MLGLFVRGGCGRSVSRPRFSAKHEKALATATWPFLDIFLSFQAAHRLSLGRYFTGGHRFPHPPTKLEGKLEKRTRRRVQSEASK